MCETNFITKNFVSNFLCLNIDLLSESDSHFFIPKCTSFPSLSQNKSFCQSTFLNSFNAINLKSTFMLDHFCVGSMLMYLTNFN